MPLGSAITSEDSGILQFMLNVFEPMLEGMGPTTFTLIFILGSALLTQVAHNLVLGGLLTSIMCVFCLQVGADPLLVALLLNLALEVALCTPAGSATSAVLFSNTEWLPTKSCYKYTATIFVINMIVIFTLGLPIGSILLG